MRKSDRRKRLPLACRNRRPGNRPTASKEGIRLVLPEAGALKAREIIPQAR